MAAVIRAPAFQRFMRALSLLAVLFLLVMPLAARQLAASASGSGDWAQLCTLAGLKLVKLDPAVPAAPDSGMPHGGGDCDYCPLLHSFATPPAPPAMAQAALPPVAAPALRAAQRIETTARVGLGSRGPPALA
jgi:hypothetical protein